MRAARGGEQVPAGGVAGAVGGWAGPWILVVAILVAALPAPASARAPGAADRSGPVPTTTSTAPSTTQPSTPTTTSTTTGPAPAQETAPPVPLPPANPAPPLTEQQPGPPPAPAPAPVVAAADAEGRRRAETALAGAGTALEAARAREAAAQVRLAGAVAALQGAQGALDGSGAAERTLAEQLEQARRRLRGLAVASYVRARPGPIVHYVLHARDAVDLVDRWRLVGAAAAVYRSAASRYDAARQAASSEVQAQVLALEAAQGVHAGAAAELASAGDQVRRLTAEVENRRLLLDSPGGAAPVAPSDIPRVFLDAYRQAASALEVRAPGCRVGATALAAVGKVESDHGRQQGAVLALNGDVLPRIVGIALDGTAGTAVVDDTDGGRVDGDPVHDRAVGPMQFIPSTWQQFAQDGNGDGLDNVNNAYDAALATATYLCRAVPAGGLDVEAGLRPALLSYNRSPSYVDKVLTWVRTYDALAGGLPAAAG